MKPVKWLIDSKQAVHAAYCADTDGPVQSYFPVSPPVNGKPAPPPADYVAMAEHLARPDRGDKHGGPARIYGCLTCIPLVEE